MSPYMLPVSVLNLFWRLCAIRAYWAPSSGGLECRTTGLSVRFVSGSSMCPPEVLPAQFQTQPTLTLGEPSSSPCNSTNVYYRGDGQNYPERVSCV